MKKLYYQYIGKLSFNHTSRTKYHLLPYHSLDVAAVTKVLLEKNSSFTSNIAQFLGLTTERFIALFSFFSAIHDLGKFSTSFQSLFFTHITPLNNFKHTKPYDGSNFRHDRLGLYFWNLHESMVLEYILSDSVLNNDDQFENLEKLRVIALTVLGHHGKPINEDFPRELKLYTEKHNEDASRQFIHELLELFNPTIDSDALISNDLMSRLKQVSWHLAGLTVLADWLGSNSDFFPYETQKISLHEYWERAQKQAHEVIKKTDIWQPLKVQPFLSVNEHYGFEPTPLQRWAETVEIDDSGVCQGSCHCFCS